MIEGLPLKTRVKWPFRNVGAVTRTLVRAKALTARIPLP